jgi:hypothetical protein
MLRRRVGLMALFAVLPALVLGACAGGSIDKPAFSQGVTGPAVLDEGGVVAGWEFVHGPDEPVASGKYPNDFGIPSRLPGSSEIEVVWNASACQTEPVAKVTTGSDSIHIDVTPGPSDPANCAAMGVGYAFRLTLTEPIADRTVTATLIDYVNRVRFEFPPG